MRFRFAIAAVAAFLATPVALPAQAHAPGVTVITGTLLGADGAPMKLAHVHLLNSRGSGLVARAQVEPDGRFALATVRTGIFRLEFTGVDHYSATIPLFAPSHITLAVDVRSSPLPPGSMSWLPRASACRTWTRLPALPSSCAGRMPR